MFLSPAGSRRTAPKHLKTRSHHIQGTFVTNTPTAMLGVSTTTLTDIMNSIITSRTIQAPLDLVFRTVSDVRNFRNAVPHITNIEFLTERHQGAGTRFRETRLMNGREQTVELEVAEFVDNERVRMISDAGGTVWDTQFTVAQVGNGVKLKMHMAARPYKLFARIMNVLIRGMIVKAVESDMDAVKSYCEADGENAS